MAKKSKKAKKADSSLFDENGEFRSAKSNQALRQKLDSDVEQFLAAGGKIEKVGRNIRTDPVKKPVSDYGSRPI